MASTATSIEWTDATWNPVTGCSKVSPGCAHCYAETVAGRFWPQQYVHTVEHGFISVRDYDGERMDGRLRQFTDVMTHEDRLDQPMRWQKPRRIFVNSMSDLFHEDVSDAFIDRVFAVMSRSERHTFQILTKRPERMRAYLSDPDRFCSVLDAWTRLPRRANRHTIERWPLPNVWLGTSVENQHFADERIPLLLQTPAAVRFLSLEPLLEQVDLTNYLWTIPGARLNGLHWLIVGGESGPGARPFDVAWARWTIAQGRSAGVPVFVKQLGANVASSEVASSELAPFISRAKPLKDRKGGDPSEWPEDLRVRQFPEAAR
jgi:protein gp37